MRRLLILFLASLIAVWGSARPIRVLSLNNSLIDYNDQAAMFNEMARSAGVDARWDKRTQLGRTLLFHYNDPMAKALVASQPWDYIILQEQSALPRLNSEILMESVRLWKMFLMENCPNKDVKIILPMNWAYSTDWDTYAEKTRQLRDSYEAVARDIPGVVVNYIGQAYQDVFDSMGVDGASRLYTDNRHPSPMATYLAACMEFGLITGIDPLQVNYKPDAVSDSDARAMREAASKALKHHRTRNF